VQFSEHERRIVRYFCQNFIHWATGVLDDETARQLDGLTPAGMENWRQLVSRICGWDAATIRRLHTTLQSTCGMSPVEATEFLVGSLFEGDALTAPS
jgi:hypothetical protein